MKREGKRSVWLALLIKIHSSQLCQLNPPDFQPREQYSMWTSPRTPTLLPNASMHACGFQNGQMNYFIPAKHIIPVCQCAVLHFKSSIHKKLSIFIVHYYPQAKFYSSSATLLVLVSLLYQSLLSLFYLVPPVVLHSMPVSYPRPSQQYLGIALACAPRLRIDLR